jgi:hypothetical protein
MAEPSEQDNQDDDLQSILDYAANGQPKKTWSELLVPVCSLPPNRSDPQSLSVHGSSGAWFDGDILRDSPDRSRVLDFLGSRIYQPSR